MTTARAVAHPNIALVKYWGKASVPLNLPAVPSVSMTLDGFETRTEVTWGASQDEVHLDGAPASPRVSARTLGFLDTLDAGRPPCRVVSRNNFPTAAGLASSSSGFAALALAAQAARGESTDPSVVSELARRGSGSATRSLFGGFALWLDDRAESIAGPEHWPELRMIVAVVSAAKKPVGSTEGMERSRLTSPFYDAWVRTAPHDVHVGRQAILDRDLSALGAVMESSTFKMHAVMHSSVPPILYWQPGTVEILHRVAAMPHAYATMDAGPNVKVLTTAEQADAVATGLRDAVTELHVLSAGTGARIVP